MVPDAPTSPNEDNHDDLDYSITDIPLQLDEDSPSISPPSISIPFGFAAQLREPSPEPPASAFLMPPKPKSVANTLDHYDPKCLKPLTPRVDGSYRTPVGPPLIYPPKHAHVKASPHPSPSILFVKGGSIIPRTLKKPNNYNCLIRVNAFGSILYAVKLNQVTLRLKPR